MRGSSEVTSSAVNGRIAFRPSSARSKPWPHTTGTEGHTLPMALPTPELLAHILQAGVRLLTFPASANRQPNGSRQDLTLDRSLPHGSRRDLFPGAHVLRVCWPSPGARVPCAQGQGGSLWVGTPSLRAEGCQELIPHQSSSSARLLGHRQQEPGTAPCRPPASQDAPSCSPCCVAHLWSHQHHGPVPLGIPQLPAIGLTDWT